jgi:hypothetical protein
MFVLCPHCQFLVALDPVSGQPPLHCPRCSEPVQPVVATALPREAEPAPIEALELAPTTADEATPAPVVEAPAAVEEIAAGEIADPTGDEGGSIDTGAEAPVDAGTGDDERAIANTLPAEAPRRKRAPSFVRGTPAAPVSASTRGRWLVPATISMLALMLLLQVALADRTQLAADPRWRPLVSTLCNVLRCTVPAWHEPSAFTLLDRDVRPDPRVPGVLHVTASFRNDARWPQRWPMLLLTLSDVDGRIAGARLFAPREYLDAAATQNGLASGQSVSIAMDVIEPAPGIVAFTFDFR